MLLIYTLACMFRIISSVTILEDTLRGGTDSSTTLGGDASHETDYTRLNPDSLNTCGSIQWNLTLGDYWELQYVQYNGDGDGNGADEAYVYFYETSTVDCIKSADSFDQNSTTGYRFTAHEYDNNWYLYTPSETDPVVATTYSDDAIDNEEWRTVSITFEALSPTSNQILITKTYPGGVSTVYDNSHDTPFAVTKDEATHFGFIGWSGGVSNEHAIRDVSMNFTCPSGFAEYNGACYKSCEQLTLNNSDTSAFNNQGTTSKTVTCDAGYSSNTIGGSEFNVTCIVGDWTELDSCIANSCETTQVANSDYSTSGTITGSTGDTVAVTCDDGYSGGGTTTCETTGVFSSILCEGSAHNMNT